MITIPWNGRDSNPGPLGHRPAGVTTGPSRLYLLLTRGEEVCLELMIKPSNENIRTFDLNYMKLHELHNLGTYCHPSHRAQPAILTTFFVDKNSHSLKVYQ